MAPGLPSGSMCGSEMPMCFSTFPFVFSSLCVDATVTVFQGVRPAVTSSPGQSQAIRSLRACWAHLYLLCLFSIPFIHHPSACPQGSRPPTPTEPPTSEPGFRAIRLPTGILLFNSWNSSQMNVAAGLRDGPSRPPGLDMRGARALRARCCWGLMDPLCSATAAF